MKHNRQAMQESSTKTRRRAPTSLAVRKERIIERMHNMQLIYSDDCLEEEACLDKVLSSRKGGRIIGLGDEPGLDFVMARVAACMAASQEESFVDKNSGLGLYSPKESYNKIYPVTDEEALRLLFDSIILIFRDILSVRDGVPKLRKEFRLVTFDRVLSELLHTKKMLHLSKAALKVSQPQQDAIKMLLERLRPTVISLLTKLDIDDVLLMKESSNQSDSSVSDLHSIFNGDGVIEYLVDKYSDLSDLDDREIRKNAEVLKVRVNDPEWVKQFYGQYVAVADGEFIASDTSEGRLVGIVQSITRNHCLIEHVIDGGREDVSTSFLMSRGI